MRKGMKSLVLTKNDRFDSSISGIKASGLREFLNVTPDFIVLSADFFDQFLGLGHDFLSNSTEVFTFLATYFQKKDTKRIIVRSSSTSEQISDRGRYLSESCYPNVKSIRSSTKKIFLDFVKRRSDESRIALIFQIYKSPKVQGHLSNERRVHSSRNNWLLEREIVNEGNIKYEIFKVDNSLSTYSFKSNICLNYASVVHKLKCLAFTLSKNRERFHLEWLWDGTRLWILQVDIEENSKRGSKPGKDWMDTYKKRGFIIPKSPEVKVFETLDSATRDWHKINCTKTFLECGLPHWNFYVLENELVIKELSRGVVHESLREDLGLILTHPVTIRSDVMPGGVSMLPRTDTVTDVDSAEQFLISSAKRLLSNGHKPQDICFIVHHFIISTSGALSYAKPNLGRVRIDSTWGIVEGLYFHPHDSYEVILNDNSIKKKLRCKTKYIDVNGKGLWQSKKAGTYYDWKSSLTDGDIHEIANYTQTLSDHLNRPLTVMFFVNKAKGFPNVLPWFYSDTEIPDSKSNNPSTIFTERIETITTRKDFESIKKRVGTNKTGKKRLRINLNTEIVRDSALIDEIADFAKNENFVVHLEGSILSHPYYVFQSREVDVRCIDPLEPTYQHKEFHKLVRDKIPVKIRDNQEQVVALKVKSEELLSLLKEKAVEEALELYWSEGNDDSVEELADILEVVQSSCRAFGISFDELQKIATAKREKRGGFDEGLVLVATQENSLFQFLRGNKQLFEDEGPDFDVRLKKSLKFFQLGDYNNFKSLTEVDHIYLPYLNNFSRLSHKFRYRLSQGEFNAITIEYGEKGILMSMENLDLTDLPDQLRLFRKSN